MHMKENSMTISLDAEKHLIKKRHTTRVPNPAGKLQTERFLNLRKSVSQKPEFTPHLTLKQ